MKKINNLIKEEYNQLLLEREVLKSSGEFVLKEWKQARLLLEQEEEDGVADEYPNELFGKRKPGESSKLSTEEAYKVFGDPATSSDSAEWTTPTEKKAFNILWDMGALPDNLIKEIYILVIPTDNGDFFKFYPHGEVYSYQFMGTYKYTIEQVNGQDRIVVDNVIDDSIPPSRICDKLTGCAQGTIPKRIVIEQSRYGYLKLPELEKANVEDVPDEESNSWVDWLQTALDWLGLIPVYGDIIDAINAIIYFARGKYIDGALSCLAIIPVVGSVLSISLKTGLKGVRAAAKATPMIKLLFSKSRKLDSVAQKWVRGTFLKGKIGSKEAAALAKYGPYASKKLDSLSKLFTKVPGLPSSWARKFSGWTKKISNGFEGFGIAGRDVKKLMKMEETARKLMTKAPSKAGIEAATAIGKKMNKSFISATNSRMARTFGFEMGKYSEQIARALNKNFSDLITKLPTARVMERVPNSAKLLKNGVSKVSRTNMIIAIRKQYKLPKDEAIRLYDDLIKNLNSTADASKMEDLWILLKRTNPSEASSISRQMANTLIQSDDLLVQAYRKNSSESFEGLSAIVTKQGVDMSGIKRARKTLLGNYAIWWNEIEDLLEKAGADDVDEPNGIVLYPLYYAIRNYGPDSLSRAAGTVAGYTKDAVVAAKEFFGLMGDAALLSMQTPTMIAQTWNTSYPNMTKEEKIRQTFKLNPGKEDVVLDNYIKVMEADGMFEDSDGPVSQEDVQRIYNEYMEENA